MLTRCKRTCRDLSVSVHICGERPVTHSLQGRFVSISAHFPTQQMESRFPTHSVRSLRDINQNVISVRRECRIQGWVGNLKPTVHLERERLNTCFSEPRTKHRDGQGVSSQQNPTGDLHTLLALLAKQLLCSCCWYSWKFLMLFIDPTPPLAPYSSSCIIQVSRSCEFPYLFGKDIILFFKAEIFTVVAQWKRVSTHPFWSGCMSSRVYESSFQIKLGSSTD